MDQLVHPAAAYATGALVGAASLAATSGVIASVLFAAVAVWSAGGRATEALALLLGGLLAAAFLAPEVRGACRPAAPTSPR